MKSLLSIIFLFTVSICTIPETWALERIRWKVQVINNEVYWGDLWKEYVEIVKQLSDGKIRFKIYDPNSIVPNADAWGAIADDQLDAALSSPIYLSYKIPAVHFFSGVPFGPDFIEHTAWMRYGGGQELKNKIYSKMGIYAFDCVMTPPESGGWFKNEIKELDQLKGMKIRFLGLGAKIMKRIGMEPVLLSYKDVVPALEKGRISAVEIGPPHNDIGVGFHKIIKHNYYPGWFQPTFPVEMILNKNKWNKLSVTAREIIKTSCDKFYLSSLIKLTSFQPDAMNQMKKDGVKYEQWKPQHLKRFKKIWEDIAEEEAEKDLLFAEVYKSHKDFRKKYAIWGDRAYLK